MHEIHGFKLLEPCVVYFRVDKDRVARYQPDAILLRKRGSGIHAVVIEAESNPPAKIVPGDISLAALVKDKAAEMYPYQEVGVGSRLYQDRHIKDTYDARKPGQTIRKEGRLFLRGDEIGKLSMLLVVPNKDSRRYYGRYLELFLMKRWGKNTPFKVARCISCDTSTVASARSSIGKLLSRL